MGHDPNAPHARDDCFGAAVQFDRNLYRAATRTNVNPDSSATHVTTCCRTYACVLTDTEQSC